MKILVLNSGSSSLKYKLFDMTSEKSLIKGHIEGIGLDRCTVHIKTESKSDEIKEKVKDHLDAIMIALKSLKQEKIISDFSEIDAIGHRVVHGGEYYSDPTLINKMVIRRIKELFELAPLHNPHNLAGIIACQKILPKTPQIAVFDTAFHQTIPREAFLYGLPEELYEKFKIRKYGFHGTSHKYVAQQAIKLLGKKDSKIITCHLGNGSSITAVKNGKSIDTTMGFTPLDGLIMGTRSGDIDPEIPLFLIKDKGYKLEEVENLLNKKSGLLGISHLTQDVRDLRKASLQGNKDAKLALQMLAYRISFYIGAYNTLLGGADAIVFTAGIGEGAWFVRRDILHNIGEALGLDIDYDANKKDQTILSTHKSKIKVYIIPTNEELQIAKEVKELLGKK